MTWPAASVAALACQPGHGQSEQERTQHLPVKGHCMLTLLAWQLAPFSQTTALRPWLAILPTQHQGRASVQKKEQCKKFHAHTNIRSHTNKCLARSDSHKHINLAYCGMARMA
eukprot:1158924-Pelagomonas_calceolata.AAC.14